MNSFNSANTVYTSVFLLRPSHTLQVSVSQSVIKKTTISFNIENITEYLLLLQFTWFYNEVVISPVVLILIYQYTMEALGDISHSRSRSCADIPIPISNFNITGLYGVFMSVLSNNRPTIYNQNHGPNLTGNISLTLDSKRWLVVLALRVLLSNKKSLEMAHIRTRDICAHERERECEMSPRASVVYPYITFSSVSCSQSGNYSMITCNEGGNST